METRNTWQLSLTSVRFRVRAQSTGRTAGGSICNCQFGSTGLGGTDPAMLLSGAAVIADDAGISPRTTTTSAATGNFHFVDKSVNVPGTVTGDLYTGTTTGVSDQFVDLTPDNFFVDGLNPNLFIKSGSGNDVLVAASGRNILSTGNGSNVEVAGSGGRG